MSITEADIPRILDNTQPLSEYSKLGLFHFWRKGWPYVFEDPFAPLHYKITKNLLEMYHPSKKSRHQRQLGIIIHRESGKSTIDSFAWPLTCIWLKGLRLWVRYDAPGWEGADVHDYEIIQLPPLEENFILVASETATRAENFVNDIKIDLETRPDLDALFGAQKPQFIRMDQDDENVIDKWTKNAFTTRNRTTVWGIGAGQQTRGIKVRNRRPSLIVVDDMYSRKNTKTDTIRENLNYWYFAELENSADSKYGKIAWIGTLVHSDTVPTKLVESDLYKTVKIPLLEQWELQEALKHTKVVKDKLILPSEEHCMKLQKKMRTLSWPERHSLHSILTMYKKAHDNHDLSYFYQEYLNIPVAPEEIRFQWESFKGVPMKKAWHEGEEMYTFHHEDRDWFVQPKFYYGVDLASSDKVTADETVIAVVAMLYARSKPDSYGKTATKIFPYIMALQHGRGWNMYAADGKKGTINQCLDLANVYPPEWMECDAHSTQQLYVQEMGRAFKDHPNRTVVNPHQHYGQRKDDFILSVVEPVMQKHGQILFNPEYRDSVRKLYSQLVNLGTKDKDDIADGIAMAFLYAKTNRVPLHSSPSSSPSSRKSSKSIPSRASSSSESLKDIPPGSRWECV